MTASVNPGLIGYWPQITQHDIDVSDVAVSAEYFVGWWGNWPQARNGWYLAADEDGPGEGVPRTCIVYGEGPAGWNHPAVISAFGGCQDLGIGVYETSPVIPVTPPRWGTIKGLYR